MPDIIIRRYSPADAPQWNELVAGSRNGLILHLRGYMDYHSDRFADHSLMAYAGNRLIAVLPANEVGRELHSHGGLTFGGWLSPERHIDAGVMMDITGAMVAYMREHGFGRLIYRPVPHIFHRYPAEEDLYALWRAGGTLSSCNISTVVDLRMPLDPDRGCRSAVNAARRAGVVTEPSDDWAAYWNLLSEVLHERFDAAPVHSLEEITLLHNRFPDRIRLHVARIDGQMVAGVVMFLLNGVARCQYIAANAEARQTKALTLLLTDLLRHYTEREYRYFDFGTSNESGGHLLNRSLMEQKSRLGGRGVIYPTYQLDL